MPSFLEYGGSTRNKIKAIGAYLFMAEGSLDEAIQRVFDAYSKMSQDTSKIESSFASILRPV